MEIRFCENGIHVYIEVTPEGSVLLGGLGLTEGAAAPDESRRLVELQLAGEDCIYHHGRKHAGTMPGHALVYRAHKMERNGQGLLLTVDQAWKELSVATRMQFFDGIPVVRCETEVENRGEACTLTALSSLFLCGLLDGQDKPRNPATQVYLPHNTWFGEVNWQRATLGELGYQPVNGWESLKRVSLSGAGTWGCSEHLPMGALCGDRQTLLWQIESGASWHWEIGDLKNQLYLYASGPTEREGGFALTLNTGDRFVSPACALAISDGGFERAMQHMTRYRRAIRRPNADNAHPRVIFNDYMNCLLADPTTEKELPLIEAAREAGCEYYCIDAGWYADGLWWDGVGEWMPSEKRFPGGLKPLLDHIRARGMRPGLWLELEVMGIHCPLAAKLPDDWFFLRDGRRVIDHGRYQLDFSNPEVVRHADAVVDRLVREYGCEYIKMDYNIDAGVGTERGGVSAGAGIMRHIRGYISWLDGVFARYPELIVENCSSGGMRMEYALLSRHSIQSISDQDDYRKMARIAANCMTACTPEQAAIWSYPLRDGDEEETIFNMVNCMLLRIHQSGHLAQLSPARFAQVAQGIACHKRIVDELKVGVPFWPIGLAAYGDEYMAAGVECDKKSYLAVWHTGDQAGAEVALPLPECARSREAAQIYPVDRVREWSFDTDVLRVKLAPWTAAVFQIG